MSYKILFFKPLKKVNYFVDKRNKNLYNREALLSKNLINICGLGGIGRRARLRGVWETVPVQVR